MLVEVAWNIGPACWLPFLASEALQAARTYKRVWFAARWYERIALALIFVPIPGPIDEIIAATVAARILHRLDNQKGTA